MRTKSGEKRAAAAGVQMAVGRSQRAAELEGILVSVFCLVEELGCVAVMHFMCTCILDTTWQTSASVSYVTVLIHTSASCKLTTS